MMAIQKKIVAAGKQGVNINGPSNEGRKKVLMVAGITVLLLLILSLYLFLGRQPAAGQAIFTGQTNVGKAGFMGQLSDIAPKNGGDTFDFNVGANLGNKETVAYSFLLKYDPSILEVDGGQNGISLPAKFGQDAWVVKNVDSINGLIMVEHATLDFNNALTGENINLATISFKVKSNNGLTTNDIFDLQNPALLFLSSEFKIFDLNSVNGQDNILQNVDADVLQPGGENPTSVCTDTDYILNNDGVGTGSSDGAGYKYINFGQKGTVSLNGSNYVDTCVGNKLTEYYCTDLNSYNTYNNDCAQGTQCQDGACVKVSANCGNGVVDQGEVCDAANKNNTGCTGSCQYVKIGYDIENCTVGSKGCVVKKWSAAEVFAIKALALAKGSCYPGEMNKNVDPNDPKLYCDNKGVAITALENGKMTSPKKVQFVIELSKALKEYLAQVS